MATEVDGITSFELIVLGGGSGGLGCARRAAHYLGPNKVALFEMQKRLDKNGNPAVKLGGTCVNVGCVPKKVMWNTAMINELVKVHSKQYGLTGLENVQFDFGTIKRNRDALIQRLNDIYQKNVGKENEKIKVINSVARFVDRNTVEYIDEENNPQRLTAKTIVIATGGEPYLPRFITDENRDLVMTSDDFFNELDHLPRKIAVVGAGYIAVELGQVLSALGLPAPDEKSDEPRPREHEVSLFIRHDFPLRTFDRFIQAGVREAIHHSGVNLVQNTSITAIERAADGTKTLIAGDARFDGFDCVIYAIGRGPNQEELNLRDIGVYQDARGFVPSGKFENVYELTQDGEKGAPIDGLYAIGDINKKVALTPVAIRAGRELSDRLYGGREGAFCDYDFIPSVVFSHPPIGTCGFRESEIHQKIANGDLPGPLTRYESSFANMLYTVYESGDPRRVMTRMKVLCVGPEQRVVGLHMIGDACDEMLQGFGVAMKMGATKADFDSSIAIHPTGSEELVTLGMYPTTKRRKWPWGFMYDLSPEQQADEDKEAEKRKKELEQQQQNETS